MENSSELAVDEQNRRTPCEPSQIHRTLFSNWMDIEVKGQVDMEDAVLGAHVVEFTRYFGLR